MESIVAALLCRCIKKNSYSEIQQQLYRREKKKKGEKKVNKYEEMRDKTAKYKN